MQLEADVTLAGQHKTGLCCLRVAIMDTAIHFTDRLKCRVRDLDIPTHAILAMGNEVVAEVELVIGVSKDG